MWLADCGAFKWIDTFLAKQQLLKFSFSNYVGVSTPDGIVGHRQLRQ